MPGSKPHIHDKYGKSLFKEIYEGNFNPLPTKKPFGINDNEAGTFRIDGILEKEKIAIEIESRANKQVRGALVDLALHPFDKKLLVLIKKYSNDYTLRQCKIILEKLTQNKKIEVIELKGTGDTPKKEVDIKKIKQAVRNLR